MPELDEKRTRHKRTERLQLALDWGGFSVYDSPLEASLLGTITSPKYLGHKAWQEWMHEHYIGDSGYDHETGRITNEKLKAFFYRWYPNWDEYNLNEVEVPQTVDIE